LKVAHISHTDGGAGAGRAAYRIHRSLLDLDVDSLLFVSEKRSNDPTVIATSSGRVARTRARACEYLEAKLARREASPDAGLFSPTRFSHFRPTADARIRAADVVSLYWINGGYVSPEHIGQLSQPIVWRLSDVWPFSGGCHYPGQCERYVLGCGNCPQLKHPSGGDVSHRLWQRKARAWESLDLTVAAPSHWIASLATRSALFSGRRIQVIPTGVDLELYRPQNRAASRARFGIPQDKLVILFGAVSPTGDARKGFGQLHAALEILSKGPLNGRLLAVVFGGQANVNPILPIPALFLGPLSDDEALVAAYSSADLVAVPSLEDNLPNVALEAIACGAPVVGFNVCGMPDIVRNGWNGALAKLIDPGEMADAMESMLGNPSQLAFMGMNARTMAQDRFSLTGQAKAYLSLYQDLIERRRAMKGPST
jgi:glycosyltransferase involved in cell wall biosynthesis